MNHTESIFTQIGGVFCTPSIEINSKLNGVKAFVFDWDGVFNNAVKNENKSSTFNEADSMGTNMLRFSHYLLNKELPATAIISGEKNEMAFYFCEREHFNSCYYKVPHKLIALNHFCAQNNIQHSEVCYFFDDVLDLSIAAVCGVRVMINRKANPLFKNYLVQNNLVDYITAHESGNFSVREATEMLMGLNDNFNQCMDERKDFSPIYQEYLALRQATPTAFFSVSGEEIINGK
ncbi:MAG: phosphatase [Bacteroidetes bacterium B1(2017)]|nr:MAG: phosphatase [Bacteroidetes bacterium B1(2017)]